jgi:4-hydroxy-2-oxoheptanedioate aldolase
MYPNPLKQKLQRGDLVLGTSLPAPSLLVAGAIIQSDIDMLWIDTEHSEMTIEGVADVAVLARLKGVAPLIRVAANDPAMIMKAYDAGAVAVMVPHVNTADDAARAVRSARYPPDGRRGVSPWWCFAAGEDMGHVVKTANQETVLVVELESREAYENIDEIAQVEGIDVIFVGPTDLTASLGFIGEREVPQVEAIIEDVGRHLEGTPVIAGIAVGSGGVAAVQEKIRWGYRFFCMGSILWYGLGILKENLDVLRADPTSASKVR